MAAAAHSGSAVSVEVGLTLFFKIGSRGLEEDRKGASLVKVGLTYKKETAITLRSFFRTFFLSLLYPCPCEETQISMNPLHTPSSSLTPSEN